MLNLTPEEYILLTQNSAVLTSAKLSVELQESQEKLIVLQKTLGEIQEEVLKLEHKIGETKFAISKHQADARHIQVQFVKNRGYDPGELAIKFVPNEEGGAKILFN